MPLITFTLPLEKLELLKNRIQVRTQMLSVSSDESDKIALDNLSKTLEFATSKDSDHPFSLLEFSTDYNKNPGCIANVDTTMSLALPGAASYLDDESLVLKLNTFLTSVLKQPVTARYEITCVPDVYIVLDDDHNTLKLVRVNS